MYAYIKSVLMFILYIKKFQYNCLNIYIIITLYFYLCLFMFCLLLLSFFIYIFSSSFLLSLPFSLLLYVTFIFYLYVSSTFYYPVQEIIVANLLPLLTGESYQFVFGSVGSGNLTLISGDMYSCEVPNISQFTQEMEGWSLPYKECEWFRL